MKHITIVMLLVALLASLTVISVKAVSGMITESIKGHLQLTYPIFYVMLVVMVASCAFQIKFLNQAMKMFDATEVVPINFVFFTASAITAGRRSKDQVQPEAKSNTYGSLAAKLMCNKPGPQDDS
ncbi:NIPA-like protein 2 isoform X3 [Salmo trutta]|nr:NIPA-like protein 2 isoform X3 [Salmo trutta]